TKTENAADLRQRGRPAFGRKMEGVSGESNRALLGDLRTNVISELDRMASTNRPRIGNANRCVARIVSGGSLRNRDTVPTNSQIRWAEAAAGKTNIEGIEDLITSIFDTIFGNDVNARLGLRNEGDLHFLFFDDISGTKGGGAGGQPARRTREQHYQSRGTCRGARHNLLIVSVQ